MDRLTQLEVLSKIAETGSCYETARSLNLSRPTVTRLMAELEKDLNQKLLFRNTRRVSLTSAGESFLPRARELLNMASDIFHSPRHSEKYDGLYRINIATTYANFKLPELIEEFQKLHPGLRIELLLSASPLPLVQNRIDLRFQIGGKVNPLYIKRSLGKSNSWMCASPSYLDTHSRPETIKDLLKQDLLHNLVIDEDLGEELLHVKGRGVYTWWFTHGDRREKLKVAPKFACNYSEPLFRAFCGARELLIFRFLSPFLMFLKAAWKSFFLNIEASSLIFGPFMHLPRINRLSLKNFLPTLSELLKRSWLIRLNKEPRRIKSYSAQ